jgi:hypothetical protein
VSNRDKLPGKFKKKALYLIKVNHVTISNDNLDSEVYRTNLFPIHLL